MKNNNRKVNQPSVSNYFKPTANSRKAMDSKWQSQGPSNSSNVKSKTKPICIKKESGKQEGGIGDSLIKYFVRDKRKTEGTR